MSDPLLAALARAAPYIDARWEKERHHKIPPSALIKIPFCMDMFDGSPRRVRQTRERAVALLTEARRRYRAGFYADPFGDPIRRPKA